MSDDADAESMGASAVLIFQGDGLEPETLREAIPLKVVRARRKGQLVSRQATRVSPSGFCSFSTADTALSSDGNAHIEFLLSVLEPGIAEIRALMAAGGLAWEGVFFDGDLEGQSFADLRPDLLQRAAALGLPIIPASESLP